jgi:hypothetical protein
MYDRASRSGSQSRHCRRAAATSGRACSSACTVFFNGQSQPIDCPPQRAQRGRRRQPRAQLRQRGVRLGRDQAAESDLLSLRERTPPELGLLPRGQRSGFPPPLDQPMHPGTTDVVRGGNILGIRIRIPRAGDALSKIHRIRRHGFPPRSERYHGDVLRTRRKRSSMRCGRRDVTPLSAVRSFSPYARRVRRRVVRDARRGGPRAGVHACAGRGRPRTRGARSRGPRRPSARGLQHRGLRIPRLLGQPGHGYGRSRPSAGGRLTGRRHRRARWRQFTRLREGHQLRADERPCCP